MQHVVANLVNDLRSGGIFALEPRLDAMPARGPRLLALTEDKTLILSLKSPCQTSRVITSYLDAPSLAVVAPTPTLCMPSALQPLLVRQLPTMNHLAATTAAPVVRARRRQPARRIRQPLLLLQRRQVLKRRGRLAVEKGAVVKLRGRRVLIWQAAW